MRLTSVLRFLLFVAVALAVVLLAAPDSAQAQSWNDSCQGALPPRLVPGQQGRVTPGLPNLLRSQPGIYGGSQIVGQMPGGAVFSVVFGHASQCANGMWWTLVNYNSIQGWTPEGSAYGVYWTEPAGVQPPPPPPSSCSLPTRMVAGGQARVTPGLPNVVRSAPGLGWNSVIVGAIPGSGVFTVLAGYAPQCADGMQWYYVNYNGLIGWTAEGQNGVYWTEPVGSNDPNTCAGISTRLDIYAWARVTPGLPNNVRAEPSLGGRWLGRIPAGATFQVIAGPVCNNGILWWQANYNGLIGWTGEGRAGYYWLERIA